MKRTAIILMVAMALITGCESDDKAMTPIDYPERVEQARQEARGRLESVGVNTSTEAYPEIVYKAGRPAKGGGWAYLRGSDHKIVGGSVTTDGKVLTIATSPSGDWFYEGMVHEFAHAWLIVNGYPADHNPKYAPLFHDWR